MARRPRKSRKSRKSRKRRPGRGTDLALAYLGEVDARAVILSRVLEEHIKRVLEATDGNMSLAAQLLGMHRRSLQRQVRRKRLRAGRKR